MALQLNPNDRVERDERGRIRSISHAETPSLEMAFPARESLSPQQIAEQYLRETTNLFDVPESMMSNLTGALRESAPDNEGPQLRLQTEKEGRDTFTVTYAQTDMGIPVFNSSVSVRIQKSGMRVMTAENEVDYDFNEVAPPPADGFVPDNLTVNDVRRLVGLQGDARCDIVKMRLLIYRYDPADRIEYVEAPRDEEGHEMAFASATTPTLPLPPVAESIQPGRYYVVTDVDCLLPWDVRPQLPWKLFIETVTGSVLRARPAVASATACVFMPEPTTQGSTAVSTSPAGTLDPLRGPVALQGLAPPNPATGQQALSGDFVRVVNTSPPATAPPTAGSPFSFCYSARSTDFAAASAYHHCDALFRLVQDMGFPVSGPGGYFDGTTFPVPVDHDGFNSAVNAQAPGNSTQTGSGGFIFGVANNGGPMGIAADARIAWHEFGHAVLWDHVGSPNFGFAHSPGDTFGALLFDPDTQAADRFETFPFMKASNGLSRRHDRDVNAGWGWRGANYDRQYRGEQVFSTTLFRIYQASGGDSADPAEKKRASRYVIFLILKAIELLTGTTTRPEVYANALMDADRTTAVFETTPGGALHKVIRWSFEKQGLYQPLGTPLPVTGPGAPPDVDVYINDGRNGEYMPYLPSGGTSADIVNRHSATGGPGGGVNQPPVAGVPNFLFVRVRNRGTQAASGVRVQVHSGGGSDWPGTWAAAAPPFVIPGSIPAGGFAIAGPITWTPGSANPAVLVEVNATGDDSVVSTVTATIDVGMLTLLDNNIKMRQF
jgi:zinc metalloprotease ZmpB